MNHLYFLLFSLFFFSSCEKKLENIDHQSIANPARFFPSTKGFWQEYQLDSTIYTKSPTDLDVTIHNYTSYLREEIGDSLLNFTSPYPIQYSQFWRSSLSNPWSIYRTSSFLIQSNFISKKEGQLEFVKLQFPISNSMSWLGNRIIDDTLTNLFAAWNFKYSDLNKKVTIGTTSFDSTINVVMYIDSNAIERNYFIEIYAANVGLIYAEYSLLRKENGANPWSKPENGFTIRKSIIDWKK